MNCSHFKNLKQKLGKWDESVTALFTLLQLIPPAAQGKGKGSRSTIEDARDLLISFYKVNIKLD